MSVFRRSIALSAALMRLALGAGAGMLAFWGIAKRLSGKQKAGGLYQG